MRDRETISGLARMSLERSMAQASVDRGKPSWLQRCQTAPSGLSPQRSRVGSYRSQEGSDKRLGYGVQLCELAIKRT